MKIKTLRFFNWKEPIKGLVVNLARKLLGSDIADGHDSLFPGGAFFDMGMVTLHIVTDVLSAINFLKGKHYAFASVVWFFYCFHLLSFREVYCSMGEKVNKSLKQGYWTDSLLKLRDSQRGTQGIPVFLLSSYAWIWAVYDWKTLGVQLLQLALGAYGAASFSVEREIRAAGKAVSD